MSTSDRVEASVEAFMEQAVFMEAAAFTEETPSLEEAVFTAAAGGTGSPWVHAPGSPLVHAPDAQAIRFLGVENESRDKEDLFFNAGYRHVGRELRTRRERRDRRRERGARSRRQWRGHSATGRRGYRR